MKRFIIILFFIPLLCQSQLGIVLRTDTIFSFDPNTTSYIQLTKLVPSQSGQSGKYLSTDGTNYTWINPVVISGKVNYTDTSNMLQNYRTVMIAAANKTANLSGTNTGDQTISDVTISTTDITTNNVSTSKHGFAPKGNGSSTSYLDGTGAYSTPSATTGSFTFLSGDVTNNNASANTIADVTGLSFSVTSGVTYKFRFFIVYTSAATTTGSRWSINGPATTYLNYNSTYTLTATSQTLNSGVAAYNSPSGASASSLSSNNIAIIEGIIKPSASGTVIARFASEISNSAIVAKANQSYVEFQAIN